MFIKLKWSQNKNSTKLLKLEKQKLYTERDILGYNMHMFKR